MRPISDDSHSPVVEVGRFETRSDAEAVRSVLAAVGIPALLASDQEGGYPVDRSGGTRLLVAEADVGEAYAILRAQEGK
jgi:hypothetical protein